MKLIGVVSCACIAALCGSAQAGLVYGQSAEDTFVGLHASHNENYLDFEGVTPGTDLLPGADYFGLGVRFASIINTSGNPFGPEHVEISNRHLFSTYGLSIVGSPFQFGSDDGRVGYEITFDDAQRRVGMRRIWSTSSITRFYNAAGGLLGEHRNTVNNEFVGWFGQSTDGSDWVARVVCDGAVVSGHRGVGHTDDLYFGVVPAPAGAGTLLFGIGLASRRRRS